MQYRVIHKTVSQARRCCGYDHIASKTASHCGQHHVVDRTLSHAGLYAGKNRLRARSRGGQDHVAGKTTSWARLRGEQDHVVSKTTWRIKPRRYVTWRRALLDAPNTAMAHQRGQAKKTPLVDDMELAR